MVQVKMEIFQHIAIYAGAVMPLFNIPMILRIIKRKSSDDISLVWLLGVWTCILLMLPATFASKELSFRLFGYSNLIFFTAVVFVTIKYHHRVKDPKKQ
ncbi:MAG TPA: hypothetical protein PLO78_07800 [Candidatus Omnitrophota bacterium]|nr:hypothetical protein [Candidatus Omnitrophota bacterium]